MVAQVWTKAQVRAYALADNKPALNAGWDQDLLALKFTDLQELGSDLDLTGFSDDAILAIGSKQNEGADRPHEAPEPPVNPVSKPGLTRADRLPASWRLHTKHRIAGSELLDHSARAPAFAAIERPLTERPR
jgi:hypothetical protein